MDLFPYENVLVTSKQSIIIRCMQLGNIKYKGLKSTKAIRWIFVDEQANVLVSASEIDIPNYSQAQIK